MRTFSEMTIRHEHMEIDAPTNNSVAERGLSLIQGGGKAACREAPRVFSW